MSRSLRACRGATVRRHGPDPEARPGRRGGQQRGAQGALRRAGRPAADAADPDRRGRRCGRSTTTGRPPSVRGARRPGAAGDAAGRAGALLRPAPRLLARRALRDRRPADVPRRVRRGVVPQPRPRHGALGRRGAARGDRGGVRARRRPPVHVVGWSLGGIFSLLTAADRRDLPIASLTVVGSPVDVSQVPLVAPLRPLLNLTEGRGAITRAYRLMGGAPKPLVKWAFQLSSFQKLITKPLAVATHLDDADFLAQIEAVDRFTDEHDRLPGPDVRAALPPVREGQRAARRAGWTSATGPSTSPTSPSRSWSSPAPPTASPRSPPSRRWCPCSPAPREVRFEIVPGGHLGMLTGRAARGTTWRVWTSGSTQWSSRGRAGPAKKTATKKAAEEGRRQEGAARRRRRRRSGRQDRRPGSPATPTRDAIGVNPTRRYGSAGSRSLAR